MDSARKSPPIISHDMPGPATAYLKNNKSPNAEATATTSRQERMTAIQRRYKIKIIYFICSVTLTGVLFLYILYLLFSTGRCKESRAQRTVYPFIVILLADQLETTFPLCLGTLIKPTWTIFPEQCVYHQKSRTTFSGDVLIDKVRHKITHVFRSSMNSQFKGHTGIALVQIGGLVKSSTSMGFVTLPPDNFQLPKGVEGALLGIKLTKNRARVVQTFTHIYNYEICQELRMLQLSGETRGSLMGHHEFCAGDIHGFQKNCKDDLRGPIFYNDSLLLGILKTNPEYCATKGHYPYVYFNVVYYAAWIRSIITNQSLS